MPTACYPKGAEPKRAWALAERRARTISPAATIPVITIRMTTRNGRLAAGVGRRRNLGLPGTLASRRMSGELREQRHLERDNGIGRDAAPASGPPRIPGVAAAIERRAVGLAPDQVGDPRRAHRHPEIVAIGEGVPVHVLVRRARGEVREPDPCAPRRPTVLGLR